VYPNPASNFINVSLLGNTSGKGTLQVVDMKGTVLIEEVLNRNLQQINIARLPKGVYMLKVKNGDKTTSSKFVKE